VNYPLINVEALVKELLALKANQEDIIKRLEKVEQRVYNRALAPDPWETGV
jgi:hypothetical protein